MNGKLVAGTSAHETIARALCNDEVRTRLLSAERRVTSETVTKAYRQELERAVGGREVAWYGSDKPDKIHDDRIKQVTGLLNDLHKHVAEIVAIEPGFIVRLGDYRLSGHLDLVYRPRGAPQALAFADWKRSRSPTTACLSCPPRTSSCR